MGVSFSAYQDDDDCAVSKLDLDKGRMSGVKEHVYLAIIAAWNSKVVRAVDKLRRCIALIWLFVVCTPHLERELHNVSYHLMQVHHQQA